MKMSTHTNPPTNVWLPKICTTGWHGGWSHQSYTKKPTPSQQWTH
jgi:hypothetical protein